MRNSMIVTIIFIVLFGCSYGIDQKNNENKINHNKDVGVSINNGDDFINDNNDESSNKIREELFEEVIKIVNAIEYFVQYKEEIPTKHTRPLISEWLLDDELAEEEKKIS